MGGISNTMLVDLRLTWQPQNVHLQHIAAMGCLHQGYRDLRQVTLSEMTMEWQLVGGWTTQFKNITVVKLYHFHQVRGEN